MGGDKFNPNDFTYQTRINIGFNNIKGKWSSAQAEFSDNSLRICGHPVMERWEDNYMKTLADIATFNGGVILEVGFGLGISATYIQKNKIVRHIIIEANCDVFQKAKCFAQNARYPVQLIFSFWEDCISKMDDEILDGILFDTYPLQANEIHKNHFNFFNEAYRLLKNGGVFTYYSDEINDFSQEHLKFLAEAGFKKISSRVCEVKPPADCQYWQNNTILAPIIIK